MICSSLIFRYASEGRNKGVAASVLSLLLAAVTMPVLAATPDTLELLGLSLEELATIRVTSVSGKSESLAEAPASIYVIAADDIQRSGATTLPEVLRLAPNLQVAQVDARSYAITARGFNGPLTNKLLVLIDGRIVYSPLFSGVFWDAQDVVLEDIERIEVISGPGSTLWGANAVNGVINVITRSAADSQGTLALAGAGSEQKTGVLRHGGTLANGGHYRVYGKHAEHDDTERADGSSTLTGWRRQQAGFRADWEQRGDVITLHGDAYDGSLHQQGTQDIRIAGANLAGHLSRTLGDGSDLRVQAYWDYTERKHPGTFAERLNIIDLDFQHTLQPLGKHNVIWGGGYRRADDRVKNEAAFAFRPAAEVMHWTNLFVQDEVEMRENLRLTAGLKLEHNNYTGTEFLPTLRLAYKPTEGRLLWAAATRSVRVPSRVDRDFYAPAVPMMVGGEPRFMIAGGPDFDSEVANVVEFGYRVQSSPSVSWSATAFYASYDKLRTLERNPSGFDSVVGNQAEGRVQGVELWGKWQVKPAWRLSGGAVVQSVDASLKPGSTDASGTTVPAPADPSHYWTLRSTHDISSNKELDFSIRRVGALPAVPAYTSADVRFAWKVRRNLELSIVGRNLLDKSHPEFGAAPLRSEIERSVFIKLLWRH